MSNFNSHKFSHYLKPFTVTVLWCFCISVNCCFLLRWLSGDRLLIVRIFNYFLPWFGLFVVSFLIISIFLRKRLLASGLVIPLVVMGGIYAPMFTGCIETASLADPSFNIMSYNIWQFNRNISETAAIIKEEKPDILLLQEVAPDKIEILEHFLENLYNGNALHVTYEPGILQAVISRYPIKSVSATPNKNRLQEVILETPLGFIRVINIHAYKHGWRDRHYEMEKIVKEDIIPENGPLIFGGDFNTNDQTETYDLVNRHLRDAYRQVGCGFGFTFPATTSFFTLNKYTLPKYSMFPVIRIDHIFYSNQFAALNTYVVHSSGGSDHFPVVAMLELSPD